MNDLISSFLRLTFTASVVTIIFLLSKTPETLERWEWRHGGRERTKRLIASSGARR